MMRCSVPVENSYGNKQITMNFGTFVPQGWKMDLVGVPVEDQWTHLLKSALHSEDLGYHSLWVYDHFHTIPVPTQESTFDAWTLMAALAATTSTIRLGQMCTSVPYRSVTHLAKVSASIDAISGGRLDVGIGAGWYEHEFNAYGYEFPGPKVRLDKLEEAAQILIEMWTADEAHFSGEHYTADGAINRPRPIQDPYPPLWIAGSGEKRTLQIVAKYGDYANLSGGIDNFLHKSEVLREHCEAVGRPSGDVKRSGHLMGVIGMNDADLGRKLEVAAVRRNMAPEEFANGDRLAGTVGEVVDLLGRFKDAGCSDMLLYYYDLGEFGDEASMDVFASEVLPQLI